MGQTLVLLESVDQVKALREYRESKGFGWNKFWTYEELAEGFTVTVEGAWRYNTTGVRTLDWPVITFKEFETLYLNKQTMNAFPEDFTVKGSASLMNAFLEELKTIEGYDVEKHKEWNATYGPYENPIEMVWLKVADNKATYQLHDCGGIKCYQLPQKWDEALEAAKNLVKLKEDIRTMPFGDHNVKVNVTEKTINIDDYAISKAEVESIQKFRDTPLIIKGHIMKLHGDVSFGCKCGSVEEFGAIMDLFN